MRNKNWIEFSHKNAKKKNEDRKVLLNEAKNLKINRIKKGKRGKTVTVISGFESHEISEISQLLKKLKVYCCTGGSLNEEGIHLQGDMQDKVEFFLRKEGYCI